MKHMGELHIETYDTFIWGPAVAAVPTDDDHRIEAVAVHPDEDNYNLEHVFEQQHPIGTFEMKCPPTMALYSRVTGFASQLH